MPKYDGARTAILHTYDVRSIEAMRQRCQVCQSGSGPRCPLLVAQAAAARRLEDSAANPLLFSFRAWLKVIILIVKYLDDKKLIGVYPNVNRRLHLLIYYVKRLLLFSLFLYTMRLYIYVIF